MSRLCFAVMVALIVFGCGDSSYNPFSLPTEPDNLSASDISDTSLVLNWTDNSDNELGFQLERADNADFTGATVIPVNADEVSLTDTGLQPETTYYYRLYAYNVAGNSAFCDPITVVTAVDGASLDDPTSGAVRVFAYGFEDWTGDADTTPGYFSSTHYSDYWDTHELSTEVVASGNPDCGYRSAFEGNYYFHQNFYTGELDPCLGTIPDSINPHTNLGADLRYPGDPKNNFDISTAIASKTMTIRFYFRTTGNWPNAITNPMKFIRVYGAGQQSSMILLDDASDTFDLTDKPHPDVSDSSWSDYHNVFQSPINWNDGEWHCVVMVLDRLNDTNVAPNLRVSAWWDDWEMIKPADGAADVYVEDFGASISHIALFVNWGATFPSSNMGIDLDKLEIWDGVPANI